MTLYLHVKIQRILAFFNPVVCVGNDFPFNEFSAWSSKSSMSFMVVGLNNKKIRKRGKFSLPTGGSEDEPKEILDTRLARKKEFVLQKLATLSLRTFYQRRMGDGFFRDSTWLYCLRKWGFKACSYEHQHPNESLQRWGKRFRWEK